ncbi:MAG TPA: Crp/Fnr family transcriptional regulator [Allosphingosinicella sp.]|jgi:CRP-like cAMP-binding protein
MHGNHSARGEPFDRAAPFERMIGALARLASFGKRERAAIRALPHELKSFGPGERLVEGGRAAGECHLLLGAFAHKEKFSGKIIRVVAINLPGEIVNIESILGLESDYSARTFRAGEVAVIPVEALRELAFSLPAVGRALWLQSQMESALYREWLLNDSRRGLRGRAAHLIAETAARLHLINSDGIEEIVLPLSAGELARALGSVPLYVQRELDGLAEAGAIEVNDEGVTVSDPAKLAALGDFDPQYLLGTHGAA